MGFSGVVLPFLKFRAGSQGERSSLLNNTASDSDEDVEEGIFVPRLKPNAPKGGIRKFYERVKLLLPFLWPSDNLYLQFMIVMCILLLMLGNVISVLAPRAAKDVFDSFTGENTTPYFAWGRILYFVFLKFLQGSVGLVSSTQKVFWIPVGQYTTKAISVKMFKHLHNLSLRFHINRKTGEVLRVQDRGVASIVSLLNSLFFNIVPTLVDIGVACAYFTYHFDIYFGTIVFMTMGLYILSTIIITDWRTKYRRLANNLDNAMEAKAVDSLLNFETVKYYNAEDYEVEQYTKAINDYQSADWMNTFTLSLLNTTQNTIIQLGLLVGCLLCSKRIVHGEMTPGDFMLYLTYITQLYGPLNWFGSYYRLIQKNFIDMETLLELFQEPIEVKDLPNTEELVVKKGDVVFENVSFSYDNKIAILKNISFKITHGTTVALVGPSGSGKSTLLRLLFRFYDVQGGRILIDGQDIRHVKQKDLRRYIGVVPQDTVLFNDDIRYNIRYGKVHATDKEVEKAAIAARIHNKIVGFPDGYNTRVGERGLRLSGGEKQRVAIARTILKDPPIVLLDEATSALDTNTERHIQAALKSMTKNRTTLVIAHRLSTIVHADMILVMRDGEIVERGSHVELMSNRDGVYYDLWMKQLQDDEKTKEEVLQQLEDLGTSESDMEGSTSSATDQKKV
ncbi:P-loop containing nucleoside triphosphate hydrolase protein [Basidiobolus meristosporus CBS 931.73]|uniref:p-loop containing nucleoside triphosphate hydrolase protein n=1 Tax=Basidiobolus meristosporus CBS 931.73 TaxID=1314790 RepID=A0A1Y1VU50_9FUNG|nr:P-loop containing nucleoside triphosphate hydrolase protein [Basidiobolus meristosporus CBS 931.73]|eukprot:ORX64838.1 P-loop containing nucleoside triphosphate hydrolase protein [Basidiobolus meristosporus CBS 931.73]